MGRFWVPRDIPGNPRVSLAIAAYEDPDALGCLLYALKCQTYKNWEAIVMHDGPTPLIVKETALGLIEDPRIQLWEQPHQGQYGHPHREYAIKQTTGDYIGLTNQDNYYAPVYFEAMLSTIVEEQADFVYCDFIHDYFDYAYYPASPKGGIGGCDLGNWIARADLVKATPWTDYSFNGDETFINALTAKCNKCVHVGQPPVVVNGTPQPTWRWRGAYMVHN